MQEIYVVISLVVVFVFFILAYKYTRTDGYFGNNGIELYTENDGGVPQLAYYWNDKQLFTIFQPLEPINSEGYLENTQIDKDLIASFSPIIKQAIEVFNHGKNIISEEVVDTVILQFEPEILEGLQNGLLEIMNAKGKNGGYRLMARNVNTKKIVGHGKLFNKTEKLSTFRPKELALAAVNVVSFAVGQYHLAEINMELRDIKQGINDIKKRMIEEQHSIIYGNIRYIETHIYPILMHSSLEFASKYHIKLEDINQQTTHIMTDLEMKSVRYVETIQSMKRPSRRLSDSDVEIVTTAIKEFKAEVVEPYLYCIQLKLIVFQLLSMLGHDPKLIKINRETTYNEFNGLIEKYNLFNDLVTKWVHNLKVNPPLMNSPKVHEKVADVLLALPGMPIYIGDALADHPIKNWIINKMPRVEDKCGDIENRSKYCLLDNKIAKLEGLFDGQYPMRTVPACLELTVNSEGDMIGSRLLPRN